MEAQVRDRHARRLPWASLIRTRSRNEPASFYQVSYETADGDGRVTLRFRGASTASLASRAAELLEQHGIDGNIRWIAPLRQATAESSPRRRR